MKGKLQAAICGAALMLSSCAYVQTHKNVEEMSIYYEGQVLNTNNLELYRSGKSWYITAQQARFKMSYPIVHDEVFRRTDNKPTFKLVPHEENCTIYHPISDQAAEVLRRADGYFDLQGLADEVKRTPGSWVVSLPGAQRYGISAEIAGKDHLFIEEKRVPKDTPTLNKALGKLDFIVFDIPATLVYNVAIPFMAPFVFFYEFLTESD